jgi:hypothetical protein
MMRYILRKKATERAVNNLSRVKLSFRDLRDRRQTKSEHACPRQGKTFQAWISGTGPNSHAMLETSWHVRQPSTWFRNSAYACAYFTCDRRTSSTVASSTEGTDKPPLDFRSRFPWRSEILRAIFDIRCIRLCWRLPARSYASPLRR